MCFFFEDLKTPKGHLEIKWPLTSTKKLSGAQRHFLCLSKNDEKYKCLEKWVFFYFLVLQRVPITCMDVKVMYPKQYKTDYFLAATMKCDCSEVLKRGLFLSIFKFLGCKLETVQDFLIKLDIKPLMYLLKISIFSLNNEIVRLTKIMNNLVKDLKILRFKVIFQCLKLVKSFQKKILLRIFD